MEPKQKKWRMVIKMYRTESLDKQTIRLRKNKYVSSRKLFSGQTLSKPIRK